MVNVNGFIRNTDSESFEAAIAALGNDRMLVIPPRVSEIDPERDFWLIDRAILLPENITVVLQNCTVKLSDKCRDNFFRSANCGLGIEEPEKIKNIHIRGEGTCTLLGADHPRAVGDSSKILANPCPYDVEDLCRPDMAPWVDEDRKKSGQLRFMRDRHSHSFGTDAGKEGESQYGDWRGIGILLANVENFSISNLKIVESHGWGISLESCTYGRVEKIEFDACMSKVIDGMRNNMENQDGVDIRNGCHHIVISDITGHTGDDLVALTAIAPDNGLVGGSLCSTHVMGHDWTRRESGIHDIVIRNVVGYSHLCYNVRLLPAYTKIYNVVIDGVVDDRAHGADHFGTVLLGASDGNYGKNPTDGMTNITVSNVISYAKSAISVSGYLRDSVISNVINNNPDCEAITVDRENGMVNVKLSNVITVGEN